ncbi:MAG TPA: ATP-binding protein [Chloroflexota bacterium]
MASKSGTRGWGALGWAVRPLVAAAGAGLFVLLRGRQRRGGSLTEERAARLAAEGEAHRFRDLIQALEAIVWEADPRTLRFTFVSRHAEAMLGYPVDRWLAEPGFWTDLVHPEDREAATGRRARIVAGDGHELEYRVIAFSGRVLWVRDVVHVVRDRDSHPRRLAGVMVDITDRIGAEERLRAAEQQAAQSEKLRMLGQMATGIAHDLNQSLALVAGYSELARRDLDGEPPDLDGLRSALRVVSQAAHDGGETLRRLLAFSRNRVEGVSERVDLAGLLREVAQLTAPGWRDAAEAEGRHISLHVESEGDTAVQGWPAGLREALTNLVFNAVDALPRGGTIRLSARREDDRVAVEVSDNGVGMPAEVQARVFEPFFTTKGEKGTGLGLAMVFAIAKQHAGDASVSSVPGQGTTFRLVLPSVKDATTWHHEVEPPAARPAPGAGMRILAVDDQQTLAQMVADMLEPAGHRVTTSTSGEAALARLAEGPFDVVVSDVGMGSGMNGFELAARIRARWPGTRIVLATGWGSVIEAEEADRHGVDAIVAKPYRLAELRRAIEPAPAPTS